jgi:hypothetical protein
MTKANVSTHFRLILSVLIMESSKMSSRHQSRKKQLSHQIRSGIFTRDDIKGDDTSQLKLMRTSEALDNAYH